MGAYAHLSTVDVAELIVKNDGGTFFAYAGTTNVYAALSEHASWCVGVDPGTDEYDGRSYRNVKVELDVVDVDSVTGVVWRFLRDDYREGHVYGAWLDGSTLYLDHVAVTNHDDAVKLATERGELAIFNLYTKTEERI